MIKSNKNISDMIKPEIVSNQQKTLEVKEILKWSATIWFVLIMALMLLFMLYNYYYVFEKPLHYLRNQVLTDSSLIDGATVNYKRTEYWTGTMRVSLKLPSGAAEELIKDNILKSCISNNKRSDACSNPTWGKIKTNKTAWQTWAVVKNGDRRESILIYLEGDVLEYRSVFWTEQD